MLHMPSKNPRLSVVLSPSLAATLAALSEASGESASSVVRSLLEQAAPALDRMVQLLVAANGAKQQLGKGLGASVGRVVDDLEDALAVADARMGRAVRDLVTEAQEVKGRSRGAGGGAADGGAPGVARTPVPVTRGSGRAKPPVKGVRRG